MISVDKKMRLTEVASPGRWGIPWRLPDRDLIFASPIWRIPRVCHFLSFTRDLEENNEIHN